MEGARLHRPCALVEVARILVQKRWQDRPANHDVREPVESSGTKPAWP